MKNNIGNLESQVRKMQKDRAALDKAMEDMPRTQSGTINFNFFKTKKERDVLHRETMRLTSLMNPDSIA